MSQAATDVPMAMRLGIDAGCVEVEVLAGVYGESAKPPDDAWSVVTEKSPLLPDRRLQKRRRKAPCRMNIDE